jgi:hypothetical protein
MNNKINLITPPDKLFNFDNNFLLIKPSTQVKVEFQKILAQVDEEINVYLYEGEQNIEWLLDVLHRADICIVDIDNCDSMTKLFVPYILAFPGVFYFTTDEVTPYGLLNKNRIYDLSWLTPNDEEEEEDE